MKTEADKKLDNIEKLLYDYGANEGAQCREWILDQIIMIIKDNDYQDWVEKFEDGVFGKKSYNWPRGIEPINNLNY